MANRDISGGASQASSSPGPAEVVRDPFSPYYGLSNTFVNFLERYNVPLQHPTMPESANISYGSRQSLDNSTFQIESRRQPPKPKSPAPAKSHKRCSRPVTIGIVLLVVLCVIGGIVFAALWLTRQPGYPTSLWWQHNFIYVADVKHFASDNYGEVYGSVTGVTRRLDYVRYTLNAGILGLSNILASDHGGVVNFNEVQPSTGTTSEVKKLFSEAGTRSLRVYLALPLFWTSVNHPWFEKSRSMSTDSKIPYRDFYRWEITMPTNEVNWKWDKTRHQYYNYMPGYPAAPILNIASEYVQDALSEVVSSWRKMGIQGIVIVNSTYIPKQYYPYITKLISTHSDDEFGWILDNKVANEAVQNPKFCYNPLVLPATLSNMATYFEAATVGQAVQSCAPVWGLRNMRPITEASTMTALAFFMPGLVYMTSGQEVDYDIKNELLQWGDDSSSRGYYPINPKLTDTYSSSRLAQLVHLIKAYKSSPFLSLAPELSRAEIIRGDEDILVLRRSYGKKAVVFVCSFRKLNTQISLNHVGAEKAVVVYDSKGDNTGELGLGSVLLKNNQVLFLDITLG